MERHTALYLLTDRAVDGRLEELLRRWALAGVSKRAAAALLALEVGGIEISSETVRRWMAEVAAADEAKRWTAEALADQDANGGEAAA